MARKKKKDGEKKEDEGVIVRTLVVRVKPLEDMRGSDWMGNVVEPERPEPKKRKRGKKAPPKPKKIPPKIQKKIDRKNAKANGGKNGKKRYKKKDTDASGMYFELKNAQEDMRRAANRAVQSILHAVSCDVDFPQTDAQKRSRMIYRPVTMEASGKAQLAMLDALAKVEGNEDKSLAELIEMSDGVDLTLEEAEALTVLRSLPSKGPISGSEIDPEIRHILIKRKLVKVTSIQSLAYQCLSNKWQPYGKPMYQQTTKRILRATSRSALANDVITREIEKFLKEGYLGKKRVPWFKNAEPLRFTAADGWEFDGPNNYIKIKPWGGSAKKGDTTLNSIIFRPHKMRGSTRAQYNRIVRGAKIKAKSKKDPEVSARIEAERERAKAEVKASGESLHKPGTLSLSRCKRKKGWQVAMTWSAKPNPAVGEWTAGIDLGWETHVMIAYVDDDGVPMHRKRPKKKIDLYPERDMINIPQNAIRAWDRVEKEVRERKFFNRDIYDLRTGRGRQRKLRSVATIRDKKSRIVDNAIKTVAAAVIRQLKRNGVKRVVLENLKGITQRGFDQTEGLQGQSKKKARKKHLEWHQYALRQAISIAAAKEGIEVIEVNSKYTSKMCHRCGLIWTKTSKKDVAKEFGLAQRDIKIAPERAGWGRVSRKTFRCTCRCTCGSKAKRCTCKSKYGEHADMNAAINIARRGLPDKRTQVRQWRRAA